MSVTVTGVQTCALPIFTSTWFLYHDTLLFSRIAGVLGRESDERAYGARAREILDAFNRFFLKGEGRYATLAMSPVDRQPGQTSQALPLYLDMVPPDQKEKAIDALLKAVVEIGDRHLDTGIIGTRFLFEVLRDTGHAELAFQVATQKSYPGWGYMIAEGATTVWERWEKLSGTGMNSHNHIMFGTIDAWFYRTIAGIIPTSPGWRTVRVQPWPVGGLSHAAARVMTPHGPLMVRWDRSPGELRLHLAVPVGAEAEVRIPRLSGPVRLLEGGRVWGPGGADETDGWLSVRVGSGSYDFQEESDT
jgi:alpha-L-rhamnosidase